MAFNFPNAPAENYVWWWSEGVRSYQWKGGAWRRYAGTALPTNKFINPSFQVSQQNGLTDGSNVQGQALADQFFVNYTFTTAGTYRGQRVASPTPGGSQHRLRISCTVVNPTVGASDWLVITTPLEGSRMADFGWGSAGSSQKWSVVRFGWRSPAGTYSFGVRNPGGTEAFAHPFTITPAQANTDTVQVCVVPPNTWETWPIDNTAWGWCYWSLQNGNLYEEYEWTDSDCVAGYSMTNTFMKTVGNTAELFDVGWYLDPRITGIPPEFQVPHYEDELMECQRYWYKLTNSRGTTLNTSVGYTQGVHPVPMRVNPGLSLVGSQRLHDATALAPWSSINHNNCNATNIYMGFNTSAAGFTASRPFQQLADSNSVNYVAVNARM